MKSIRLKNVSQNNLKNVNVEIPLRSFVVVCGPSGSGKSSLAFQSLFAEGQRRYLESLSNYAKQFVGRAAKPKLESAENIPPSIALEQKNSIKSSRSTVGTHTELYDYFKLLFARLGKAYCPEHNIVMKKHDPSSAVEDVISNFEGERAYMLCPLKWETKKSFLALREKILKAGYFKVLELSGEDLNIFDIEEGEDLQELPAKSEEHFLVVDRLVVDQDSEVRIFDAVSQAYDFSSKAFGVPDAQVVTTQGDRLSFKKIVSCSKCDEIFWELEPELFSFNNPAGACSKCNGFGNILSLDPKKVIPNPSLSLKEGAIAPFAMPSGKSDKARLNKYCKLKNIPVDKPWKSLTETQRQNIWEGDGDWYGVLGLFEYLERKKYKMHVRVFLSRFKSSQTCDACNGKRLNPKMEQVKVLGVSIADIGNMQFSDLLKWVKEIKLSDREKELTKEVRSQLITRLSFLESIGLGYLSLLRQTKTLSGGEFQRINLSNQLGTDLSDTLYVLDEPTIGLHPRDNDKLIALLKKLHENKNTLVVVEHDKEVILSGTHIIEMGPESGLRGGEIVFSGEKKDFLKNSSSTANYLTDKVSTYQLSPKEKPSKENIKVLGCTGHNLKNLDLSLPLNKVVCITGVSGSGKSSLITQSLYPAVKESLSGELSENALPYKKASLPKFLKEIDFVDQQRISKSKRSLVFTYLKLFDIVRKRFSQEKEAQISGYGPGTFSLNTEGGRCPQCKGLGIQEVDMLFMDNVELVCEACLGVKFKKDILKIKYKSKSIHDVLQMTCKEAKDFFVEDKKIVNTLKILESLGLGYLRVGQTLDTLSGGESQRLKLVNYLMSSSLAGKVLIFDEPSTGLHFNEVGKLIEVFKQLKEAGASVVVIEHNMDIVVSSDWVVDVGPEGGDLGGQIVASGHPLDVMKSSGHTGKYIKRHLSKEGL